ncbi:hypothetical protein ACT3UM_22885 [Halomonas sp. AOP13-D3-9]
MNSDEILLSQLHELPLTKEDQRFILHCLRVGGVVDHSSVLATYQTCWLTAAESASSPQRDNAGRRAANTFLREALGVEAPATAR